MLKPPQSSKRHPSYSHFPSAQTTAALSPAVMWRRHQSILPSLVCLLTGGGGKFCWVKGLLSHSYKKNKNQKRNTNQANPRHMTTKTTEAQSHKTGDMKGRTIKQPSWSKWECTDGCWGTLLRRLHTNSKCLACMNNLSLQCIKISHLK